MIREIKPQDIDRVMDLWLETNLSAHDFISKNHWIDNYDIVRGIFLNPDEHTKIYVYENNGIIIEFIGLIDEYIAGIFISKESQSKGIGKEILCYIKNNRNSLSLHVYKQNERAIQFYLREDFNIINEQIDEKTEKIELYMNWLKT